MLARVNRPVARSYTRGVPLIAAHPLANACGLWTMIWRLVEAPTLIFPPGVSTTLASLPGTRA